MQKDMTLINRAKKKELFNGILYKQGNLGIIPQKFNYAESWSKYDYEVGIGGIPFTQPTKTIKTSEKLAFAIGDKIRLHSGNIMRVNNIEKKQSPERAFSGGDPFEEYILVLIGGNNG